MLSSTEEYLEKLRKGDYIAALQWASFLETRYIQSSGNKIVPINGETLILIAIYELIHHGFRAEDTGSLMVLYGLLAASSPLLQGSFAYSAVLLFNAGAQYLVYAQKGMLPYYSNAQLTDADSIIQWMSRENEQWTSEKNSKKVGRKSSELIKQVPDYSEQIAFIENKIKPVLALWNCCNSYIESLSTLNKKDEEKVAMRYGIALALGDFLLTQEQNSSETKAVVADYVNKLRALEPESWEEDFFSLLSPKTFRQRITQSTAETFGFFANKLWEGLMYSPSGEDLDDNNPENTQTL